jgi:hypothetical protein
MNTSEIQISPLFSNKLDSAVFIGPVLLAGLTAVTFNTLTRYISADQLRYWFYSSYAFLFLIPHVYATGYKIKIDNQIRSGSYQTETRIFMLIFILCGFMFFKYGGIFATILTYFDIFHNVRQQYGWVVLSQKKQKIITYHEQVLDKVMIYNVTVAPLVWWHANPSRYGWMQTKDISFFLPNWFGDIALCLHWAISAYFFGYYLYRYLLGKSFNLWKIVIIAMTWLSWYLGILYLQDEMKVLFITFAHTMPYLFLVFRYQESHNSSLEQRISLSIVKRWFRYYVPLLLVAAFISSLQFLKTFSISDGTKIIAFIALSGGVFHYYFDAFVWRVRLNKSNLSTFFKLPSPNKNSIIG